MRRMILILAVAGAAIAPSIAFARTAHGHGYAAGNYNRIEETRPAPVYGPPSSWNALDQSGCDYVSRAPISAFCD